MNLNEFKGFIDNFQNTTKEISIKEKYIKIILLLTDSIIKKEIEPKEAVAIFIHIFDPEFKYLYIDNISAEGNLKILERRLKSKENEKMKQSLKKRADYTSLNRIEDIYTENSLKSTEYKRNERKFYSVTRDVDNIDGVDIDVIKSYINMYKELTVSKIYDEKELYNNILSSLTKKIFNNNITKKEAVVLLLRLIDPEFKLLRKADEQDMETLEFYDEFIKKERELYNKQYSLIKLYQGLYNVSFEDAISILVRAYDKEYDVTKNSTEENINHILKMSNKKSN